MPSRTQIICTIGPASASPEILARLISAGMNVARLNFSWGTYEEHAKYIVDVRDAAQRAGKKIPIIQDLSGPRVQDNVGHHMNPSAASIITDKDLKDLDFGLSQNVDYVCLSYVGSESDIRELRREITNRNGTAKVMAKVERREALDNIDGIISVADAIMLGRGDLGQNIPIEQIPFVESEVVRKCKDAHKPVIVATEMLQSMVENSEPTRAEVTDIAYAVVLGADAVMLSEETARGRHPVQAVDVMERVCLETEKHGPRDINAL